MRTGVLNFMKCKPGSTIASNRIAQFLVQMTGADLIDRAEYARDVAYDRLFVVNGPMLFCDFRDLATHMMSVAKELIWVGNDYAIKRPGVVKRRPHKVWAAYELDEPNHRLINWNQLTFTPGRKRVKPYVEGLAYYGAFRQDRETYFRKYLGSHVNELYRPMVSTSKRARSNFIALNPRLQFFQLDDVVAGMGRFQASIYIEDESSHDLYCSPANRFYELLSAGTMIYFDASVVGTFQRAGLDVGPWVVQDARELAERLPESEKEIGPQREALYYSEDYLESLNLQVQHALDSL